MDPSQFYTGIVAELYRPLRSAVPDPDIYASFIDLVGDPALELGCGDGDPLLELCRRGFEVEGVDSSADMLQRCQSAAAEQGLEVVLHHQRIQDLHLPRRYRSIFLAGPTFNLLTTDEDVADALKGIRAHLDASGSALIPLFIPEQTPPEDLGQARQATEPGGAIIRVTPISEQRDEQKRIQETVLRYERIEGGEHVTEDRVWTLHWHSQESFRSLAAAAGLRTAAILDQHGDPASSDEEAFAFCLQPAD